ncbi:MAG: hypothetical protein VB878_11815 [Pirellulaceae bacterium]
MFDLLSFFLLVISKEYSSSAFPLTNFVQVDSDLIFSKNAFACLAFLLGFAAASFSSAPTEFTSANTENKRPVMRSRWIIDVLLVSRIAVSDQQTMDLKEFNIDQVVSDCKRWPSKKPLTTAIKRRLTLFG